MNARLEKWMPATRRASIPWERFALPFVLLPLTALPQSTDLIDTRSLLGRGVVYELEGPPQGLLSFFTTVTLVGDTNHDGKDDLALGFPDANPDSGRKQVVVVRGGEGLSGRVLISAESGPPGTTFFRGREPLGFTELGVLHGAGDINLDGIGDLLFGFPLYRRDASGLQAGEAYLVYGNEDLEGVHYVEEIGRELPGAVYGSSDPNHRGIGYAISPIGDWNGDGRLDLAIGAPLSNAPSGEGVGIVFILLGREDSPAEVDLAGVGTVLPGTRIEGFREDVLDNGVTIKPVTTLGVDLRPAGDVNGDGLADLLVSAPGYLDRAGRYHRRVFLLLGRRDPPGILRLDRPDEREGVIEISSYPIFALSYQMAGLGDLNRDGFDDFIVGRSEAGPEASHAFVFYGRPDLPTHIDLDNLPAGLATVIGQYNLVNERKLEHFAGSVAGPGDLTGDGIPEILIGASGALRDGLSGVGEVYALFGRPDFGPTVALRDGFQGIRIVGEGPADHFGGLIGDSGDFNGDGHLDMVVLADHTSTREVGRSKVYVIYSSGSEDPPFLLHEVHPTYGSVRGGTEVSIRGSGFGPGAGVRFGDAASPNVRFVSPTELRATTPVRAVPGRVDVAVTLGTETRTLAGAFEYAPAHPEIDLTALGRRGTRLAADQDTVAAQSLEMLDFDGDGRSDLVVGSTRTLEDPAEKGWELMVILGRRGLPQEISLLEPGEGKVRILGSRPPPGVAEYIGNESVRRVGDIDGDGIQDLGIGVGRGRGYVVFGRRSPATSLSIEEEIAAGRCVELFASTLIPQDPNTLTFAELGDVTGDGIDDLAVGFEGAAATGVGPLSDGEGQGRVDFLAGRREWPILIELDRPDVFARVVGAHATHGLGTELLDVGDVDGDGTRELLVKAGEPPDDATKNRSRSAAYLISLGSLETLGEDLPIEEHMQDGGGRRIEVQLRPSGTLDIYNIGSAGDVNQDGLGDFLIDAPFAGELGSGLVYLVLGRPDLPAEIVLDAVPAAPDGVVRILGSDSYQYTGRPAPGGDFNLDGYPDILLGSAPSVTGPTPGPGSVTIVFGGPALPAEIQLRDLGARGMSFPGTLVAPIGVGAPHTGDVNGDGAQDIAFRQDHEFEVGGEPENVFLLFGPVLDGEFWRGDSTQDERLDLSDAVFILSYLFLGGASLICEDAADTDDSGAIDLSDAVRILGYLYLGAAPPLPPFPAPGPDPSPDTLHCLGF